MTPAEGKLLEMYLSRKETEVLPKYLSPRSSGNPLGKS